MGKKHRKIEAKPAVALSTIAATEPSTAPAAVVSFLERHARAIAIVAVVVASVRIGSTWNVFSQTSDEPVHVACGLEWLDKGRYTGEPQHPPIARIFTAIGPYVLGNHYHVTTGNAGFTALVIEGTRILTAGNRYDLTLTLARAGILPFFWIACWVVFEWGKRYFNRAVAAIAVCILSFTPTVLAHAGLATTDMALTAFLGASFLTLLLWLDDPTPRRAALFGLSAGLVISSKYSSLVFFPAAVVTSLVWYLATKRPSRADLFRAVQGRWKTLGLSVLICCLVIWAVFRFSFGKVYFANISLPAPELYQGVHDVSSHNDIGHASFLLGQIGKSGWWYFFPVALLFKTPLALLILLGFCGWLAGRKAIGFERWWLPLTFAAGILMVGMSSRINLGLRHILPVYVAFALLGAAAIFQMLEGARTRRWMASAVLILCGWMAVSSLLIHPDYISYFNELAGNHPENILTDSDLDWGQDFKRLGKRLKELGVDQVNVITYYDEPFRYLGIGKIAAERYDVLHPPPGWTAISISDWKIGRLGLFDRYPNVKVWPDVIPPTEKVGRGMLLWYIPPGAS
jgi:hypothetical protein